MYKRLGSWDGDVRGMEEESSHCFPSAIFVELGKFVQMDWKYRQFFIMLRKFNVNFTWHGFVWILANMAGGFMLSNFSTS